MHSDDAPRPTARTALIRTPDQVQQERRPDAPPSRPADASRPAEAPQRPGGVLGQLRTERAHD